MKKILITRTDRLGDVLLSTPVFKAVRDAYPKSHIAVMVRPYTRECVDGNPYIDEVLVYDKRGQHKSLFSSLIFALNLKKRSFDTAIILHPTNRANLVTFLAGIPERIGYNRKMGFFLTKKIPHKKETGRKHELEYTLDIVKAMGIKPKDTEIYMPIREDVQNRIDRTFSSCGILPKDKLVAMHPSSSCLSKKWNIERFAKVADTLIKEDKVKIILVGGPDGKIDAEKTKRYMKEPVIDFSGKTTIPDLAALLKKCSLFISNDSGPVHVAAAVGTPVISIFGRSDAGLGPIRWGPTGRYDIILHKDIGCTSCLAHNCKKGFLCLNAVTEDDVIKNAKLILNRKNSSLRGGPEGRRSNLGGRQC